MGAYALGGGAIGGAGCIAGGEVTTLAALNDLEVSAGDGGDGGGHVGVEAVTLEQSLGDRLHTRRRLSSFRQLACRMLRALQTQTETVLPD